MRWLLPILAVILFAGCGYHVPGRGANLPEDVQTVYIDLFGNRTAEPFLENRLTNAVIERLSRKRNLEVVEDRQRADAVLQGTVIKYVTRPISYDRNDDITEYRSAMTVEAALQRSTKGRAGKVLWKGRVSWTEEYPAEDDKSVREDNEEAAIAVLVDRLAEELFFRIVEDF